jgi:hypothetical protein
MDGLAFYGASVGTVSLIWHVVSQIRAARPYLLVTFFVKVERPAQERPAWAVIRIVNRSQRDVTLTEYSATADREQDGSWFIMDPPVTVSGYGAVHDVTFPLDDFYERHGPVHGVKVAIRLSTGEVFKAKSS